MKIKYILPVCALVVMLWACGGSNNTANPNVAVAQQMFNAFNKHNWQQMASFYADTAEFLDPSLGAGYVKQTHAQTAAKYAGLQQMFPDIYDEIIGMYPSGDKVIVEFVSSGTMQDGAKLHMPICTVLTFADGKIVKDATYYDNP